MSSLMPTLHSFLSKLTLLPPTQLSFVGAPSVFIPFTSTTSVIWAKNLIIISRPIHGSSNIILLSWELDSLQETEVYCTDTNNDYLPAKYFIHFFFFHLLFTYHLQLNHPTVLLCYFPTKHKLELFSFLHSDFHVLVLLVFSMNFIKGITIRIVMNFF